MTELVVQWVDKNVGPADFREVITDDKTVAVVNRPFYTIQGEGPLAGYPSVFVRLAGCNRGAKKDCPFCDTYFTLSEANVMDFDELTDEIFRAIARELAPGLEDYAIDSWNDGFKFIPSDGSPVFQRDFLPVIVVTGGEPSIHPNIGELLAYLINEQGFGVQIESNGDFMPVELSDFSDASTIVVSPKIAFNQPHYSPLKKEVLRHAACLKFVVSADPESKYHELPLKMISDFLDQTDKYREDVFVSPMAVYKRAVRKGEIANFADDTLIDKKATFANYAYAAKLSMTHGFRISIQSHLLYNLE